MSYFSFFITLMADCLWTDKPSQYITNPTKVNSAFHPSGVGKLSTSLLVSA